MKKLSKVLVLVLSAIMVLAMSASVFAQDKAYSGTDGDGAKITITNAASGETYKVYKIFDATVTGKEGGSIAYQGTIPSDLTTYFEYVNGTDSTNGITVTTAGKDANDSTKLSSAAVEALKAYVAKADVKDTFLVSETSDGTALNFTNLPYGFYVITSTQNSGAAITVNSTNPNATVIDKNTTDPVGGLKKKAADGDKVVSIGDVITYTVEFTTANFDENANQITKYVVKDSLPAFLSDVKITSIIVDEDKDTSTTDDQKTVLSTETAFPADGYTVAWAEGNASKYKNGSKLIVTYKATVNDKIAAGNVETNKNEVTVKPYAGDDEVVVENNTASETIKTYAAALQKVDETGANLAGATFQVPGLTVKEEAAGSYTVVSYDPQSTAAGTTMECDSNGFLVIRGLSNETDITINEVDAPAGYNKLTAGATLPVVATAQETKTTATTTTTTIYYDADGNVVETEAEAATSETVTTTTLATNDDLVAGAAEIENQKGAVLPSTGGIGTTIFYVLGSLLVVGCGIVLISRKRMQNNK